MSAPPYWLVNVDPGLHSAECPEYLLNVDENDKANLGTLDADFNILTWPSVQEIVSTNRIDKFRRLHSELRRYLEYTWKLKQRYGSVMRFIVEERLKWPTVQPESPVPFASPNDYIILFNDWPYGLVKSIVHLVVWTKFPFEDDVQTGDMTAKTRSMIDDFVAGTFHPHVPPENVLWFRNWASLKSIHAVEHFHVMLNDADPVFVREITSGDVPLVARV